MSRYCTGNEAVLQCLAMSLEPFDKSSKRPPIADDLRAEWPDILPLNKAPFFRTEIRKQSEDLRRNIEQWLKIRLTEAQTKDLGTMAVSVAVQFYQENEPFHFLREIQARFIQKYFGIMQEELLQNMYFDERRTRRHIQIRQCEYYRADQRSA